MPSSRCLSAVLAILLLLSAPEAFGWAGEYPLHGAVSHPDTWPARLVELAGLPARVGGYFVNQDDYFAFAGNDAAFRAFLEGCAALGEFAPITLHIHEGKGSFQPLDREKKPVPCDWQLDVINRHWRATEPSPKGPMYSLELHVWADGTVDLAALRVPAGVKTVREPKP